MCREQREQRMGESDDIYRPADIYRFLQLKKKFKFHVYQAELIKIEATLN